MTLTEPAPSQTRHRGRWITDWRPEDPAFWDTIGAPVARRNLFWSVTSEHIGFSVWTMWSVLVLFLGPEYGFSAAEKFLITSVPALLGAVVRIPYTLAVAHFGGRNWTIVSAGLLLVPTVAIAIILRPGVSLEAVLVAAALAGVGGGNFASSMTNINAFFPARLKGWALGMNAGGGNLGVAVVQLVGLVVLAAVGSQHPRLIVAIYIPLVVAVTVMSALRMDNLATTTNAEGAFREVIRHRETWVMSVLYLGTFGSFIGYSFAFGQVLLVQFPQYFPSPVTAAALTFLGPLLGSLARPAGGRLADRFRGSRVTVVAFVAMIIGSLAALGASLQGSLPLFVAAFVFLFTVSGLANGSTYKMIPAIFHADAQREVADGEEVAVADARALRRSGALIGLAGAIGALGGVAVNLAFRQSFLVLQNGNGAYLAFAVYYLVCVALTWLWFCRPGAGRFRGV